jgi:glucosamine-phosphate N-acetyltransferase
MEKYTIRKLDLNDYKQYTTHIQSNISEMLYTHFITDILNENHHIVVIEYESKIIASGTLFIEHKMTYGGCKMGHIENILVDECMRGNKFGSMIVNYLTNIAKQYNCYRIDLTCLPDLKKFYFSNGYTIELTSMTMFLPENYK